MFTSNSKTERQLTSHVSFGGGSVNDTLIHAVTPHTPFGGIGDSGQGFFFYSFAFISFITLKFAGSYHGKFGFDQLSHQKVLLPLSFYYAQLQLTICRWYYAIPPCWIPHYVIPRTPRVRRTGCFT